MTYKYTVIGQILSIIRLILAYETSKIKTIVIYCYQFSEYIYQLKSGDMYLLYYVQRFVAHGTIKIIREVSI